MTAATSVCEKCGQAIAAGAVLYSSAGEVTCPACNQAALAVELEQRGRVSRRRGRVVLGVVIAVVVLVPTAMFLAGHGQRMGEAMMALGVGCVFGAGIAVRLFFRSGLLSAVHVGALVAIGVVVGSAGYGLHRLAEKYHSDSDRLSEQDTKLYEARAAAQARDGASADARNKQIAADWQALEKQKQAVEKDPSSVLDASEIHQTAAGVVDRRAAMDTLTVVNNSPFALWKIQGTLDWMDGDRKVASMAFTVKERMLMPKQPRKVTTDAGTLETGPLVMANNKAQARFTRAVARFTQAVVEE